MVCLHFGPEGFNSGTNIHGLWTPGMETAAGGGLTGLGTSPLRMIRLSFLSGSMIGTADMRARL